MEEHKEKAPSHEDIVREFERWLSDENKEEQESFPVRASLSIILSRYLEIKEKIGLLKEGLKGSAHSQDLEIVDENIRMNHFLYELTLRLLMYSFNDRFAKISLSIENTVKKMDEKKKPASLRERFFRKK